MTSRPVRYDETEKKCLPLRLVQHYLLHGANAMSPDGRTGPRFFFNKQQSRQDGSNITCVTPRWPSGVREASSRTDSR